MNRRFLPCAVMTALLFFLASCSGEKKAGRDARPVPVVAVPARGATVPVVVKAVGNVEPLASVAVKPQVGGAIVAQLVKDGATVAKGDPLFRIDPRPFELAIRESQAKLERDKALLTKAEEDLKRYVTLKAKDVVAQEQYDQTYAAAKTLEGTIKLNQASLDRSKLDLEYADVRAPIAGRVGAVLLTTGNVVKANEATACVINQISPIFISFSIPERYLPAVMARQKKGRLEITASAPGDVETEPVRAAIASVDNAVDAKTGTIRLKALAENADHRLWPGQFVRVGLTIATLENAVTIPTQAVLDGVAGPYVYVVAGDGTVDARMITPGPIVDADTVVEKGLAPGEMVVTDGQVRLAPGIKAEIKSPAEAAAAEAGKAPDKAGDVKAAEAGKGEGPASAGKTGEADAAKDKPTQAKPASPGAKQ
ncbi:MAG: efflux RND transporter periplasmic adaptor subunit [Acidobacteriota bacterium]